MKNSLQAAWEFIGLLYHRFEAFFEAFYARHQGLCYLLALPLSIVLGLLAQHFFQKTGNAERSSKAEGKTRAQLNGIERRALLDKVQEDRVDPRLGQGLREAIRVDLNLTETPAAVLANLRVFERPQSGLRYDHPTKESIQHIFEQTEGGSLLILGAPGTGKTNLLLELAQSLIADARRDQDRPIPIVFSLARWSLGKLPRKLAEWMKDDLRAWYGLSPAVADALVEEDRILPLFDGLDEVGEDRRQACTNAIAEYQRGRKNGRMAVCCRLQEYDRLKKKLDIEAAIRVEPLTQADLDREIAKPDLKYVRDALAGDVGLRSLVNTPLWLHVLYLAARTEPSASAATNPRDRLYARYVEYALHRNLEESNMPSVQKALKRLRELEALASVEGGHAGLSKNEVIRLERERKRLNKDLARLKDIPRKLTDSVQLLHWLGWVAVEMSKRNQPQFAIEDLDFSWLGSRGRARWRHRKVTPDKKDAIGQGHGTVSPRNMRPVQRLLFGLTVGSVGGLAGGLVFGLIVGLLAAYRIEGKIEAAEDTRFKWRDAKSRLSFSLGYGALFGLAFALTNGVTGGLCIGLFAGAFEMFLGGLQPRSVSRGSAPNRATLLSVKYALRITVFGWILACSMVALARIFASHTLISVGDVGVVGHAAAWVAFGATMLGGEKGGWFVLRHYTVRLLLWLRGLAPLAYVTFLNETADRLFLIRHGGNYEFLHLTFRDYIAANYGPDRGGTSMKIPHRRKRTTHRLRTVIVLCTEP